MPPQNDDQTPIPSANPASPRRAIGKPSNVVATEDGVPGMPVRMPDIKPPDSPPTKTEIIVARPCAGGIEKVKGSVNTTAIAIVKPGMDPAINPAPTPITMKSRVAGSTIFASANRKISMLHLEPSQSAARQKHLKHE